MKKPLIGVTPRYDDQKQTTYIQLAYMDGIIKAGGIALLLPATSNKELLMECMERLDGFLLSGGPDVDPFYYGEANLPCNGEISPIRDEIELFLVRWAIENNKPILGICRGAQVMNVAMGGTLYQDIYSQIQGKTLLKHFQNAPYWYATHSVVIEKGSIVERCFGMNEIRVNTFHHQAIKDVAPCFLASSRAEDGIVESIEHPTHKFAVGVQWHPEYMWEKDGLQLRLFEALVEACR